MPVKNKRGRPKNTEQKKTPASRTKQSRAAQSEEFEKARQVKKQKIAVILFALSLFFLFIVAIKGGSFWETMHSFMFGLFGFCAWFWPVLLGYIAIMSALNKPLGNIKNKVIESALIIVFVCAVIDVFSKAENAKFGAYLTNAYKAGVQIKGGGFIGALIGYPIEQLLGIPGAPITIILIVFVLLMLLTGTTLLALFRGILKPVKKVKSYVAAPSQNETPDASGQRFDVDVPLGDLPAHPVQSNGQYFEQNDLAAKEARLLEVYAGEDSVAVTKPDVDIDDIVKRESKKTKEKEPAVKEPAAAKVPSATTGISIETGTADAYRYPPLALLNRPVAGSNTLVGDELKANAERLVNVLRSFGVETRITDISRGPSVTRYELQPSAGVKISKITNLADDIALNLAATAVRIEAPIPNKAAVGIEIPNKVTSIVTMNEVVDSTVFVSSKSKLTAALGKDITGNIAVADLAKMPHLLIAGATGSGKSVCINSLVISLLYKSTPDEVKFLMIDPKVVELGIYNGIPHLLVPVVTDPRKAAGALGWAVTEMLKRYKIFAENNVRDLPSYNAMTKKSDELQPMPQIVIIIDELADLMMVAPNEVEDSICRLAQMARAAGMHLVIATQRPSVDVITGIIKANIPSRVAFAVSSQVDSRTILDMGGAEKLLGRGDMLYSPIGSSKPTRVQGCFVSDNEIKSVVNFVKGDVEPEYDEKVLNEIEKQAVPEKGSKKGMDNNDSDSDDKLYDAIDCVVEAGIASTSLLQRRLKLGYARAARIIDEMEERGIVGPFEGSKPRTVTITRQQWLEMKARGEN